MLLLFSSGFHLSPFNQPCLEQNCIFRHSFTIRILPLRTWCRFSRITETGPIQTFLLESPDLIPNAMLIEVSCGFLLNEKVSVCDIFEFETCNYAKVAAQYDNHPHKLNYILHKNKKYIIFLHIHWQISTPLIIIHSVYFIELVICRWGIACVSQYNHII